MKRILVGGMHHESDTFNPIITKENDISVLRGDKLLNSNTRSAISGMVNVLKVSNYQIIPSLFARAVPNGPWDKEYYLSLKEELLKNIKDALPLDGLCLALHGSMRVDKIGKAEDDLLSSIRELVPNAIIVCSLDMHATMTKIMIENANAFVGYKTAPHVDTFETGAKAAQILIDCLTKNIKPISSCVHIPFMVAGEQSETSVEPMVSLISNLKEVEKQNNVLSCSYLMGFPWADVEENGVSAMVVTNDDKALSDKLSMQLAKEFWKQRENFKFYNLTLEPLDAIDKTNELIKSESFPIVISDSGDNPTAGSSGDVTSFLKQIIDDKRLTRLNPPLCYQAIYDPEVVKEAMKLGVGARIYTLLGAKFDRVTSSPLSVSARIKALKQNYNDTKCNLALLEFDGVDVIVTSEHVGCYEPQMMRALGVEPKECKVIVVKLGYLEPEIRSIAKSSMMALTTGSSNEIFTRLKYKNISRPIYPLDKDFEVNLCYI